MLKIRIPKIEFYDEKTELFFDVKEQDLILEHSLVSIAKWESKWKKPFLTKTEKTDIETMDYIKCMTINNDVNQNIYKVIPGESMRLINSYIQDSMTATTFYKENKKPNRETITSELIYFWMINYNIPPEYQKWHLNRLLTLIELCSIKNQPPKKLSNQELIERNRTLNAERLKALNTTG